MEKIKLTETVTAAQNGDSAALETLYKEYAKPVYFLALKLLANKEDSEDITQDVFIHMFQKIGELKTPEAFPTWINRITAGKCTDFLRKKKLTFNIENEEMAQTEFFEEKDPLLVPDKSLDNAETVKIITEIIDNLPLPQRLCVYYYYYENLTIAQIAENLATNENTVKNRLALAREKIRKALEELEEKEGLKLYGALPLMLTPILRRALQQFEMPQEIMANIFDGVTSVVDVPTDGVTSVIETAADGIATVTETATAGTATTTAGNAATSALSTKAIAGIVAGVVIVCGVVLALVFGNFGGSDEPFVPVDIGGNEIEDEPEEPAPANVDEPAPDEDEVTPPDDEPYIEDDEPPVLEDEIEEPEETNEPTEPTTPEVPTTPDTPTAPTTQTTPTTPTTPETPIVTTTPPPPPPPATPQFRGFQDELARELFNLINTQRATEGLGALMWSDSLETYAREDVVLRSGFLSDEFFEYVSVHSTQEINHIYVGGSVEAQFRVENLSTATAAFEAFQRGISSRTFVQFNREREVVSSIAEMAYLDRILQYIGIACYDIDGFRFFIIHYHRDREPDYSTIRNHL